VREETWNFALIESGGHSNVSFRGNGVDPLWIEGPLLSAGKKGGRKEGGRSSQRISKKKERDPLLEEEREVGPQEFLSCSRKSHLEGKRKGGGT